MTNNKAIEKYNHKTIRIKGRIYHISIWGDPASIQVQLEARGTNYDIACADYYQAHLDPSKSEPSHIAACYKAQEIQKEVEDNAEVDFEE